MILFGFCCSFLKNPKKTLSIFTHKQLLAQITQLENNWYISKCIRNLETNNKTQTISLVRKCFKLFWFLAIRVKQSRFLGFLFYHLPTALSWRSGHVGRNRVQRCQFLSLKNEFNELGFQAWKPTALNSISRLENRVQWTCFSGLETDSFELGFFVCKTTRSWLKNQKVQGKIDKTSRFNTQ